MTLCMPPVPITICQPWCTEGAIKPTRAHVVEPLNMHDRFFEPTLMAFEWFLPYDKWM
jgi:hypothetical protein